MENPNWALVVKVAAAVYMWASVQRDSVTNESR